MRRPLFVLFVAFVMGLVVGRSVQPGPAWVLGFAFLMVALSAAVLRCARVNPEKQLWVFLVLLMAALGALRYAWSEAADLKKSEYAFQAARQGPVALEARVESPVEKGERRYRFTVGAGQILDQGRRSPLPIRCRVEGPLEDAPQVEYGDRVLLRGYLSPPRAAVIPDGFNDREYLAAQNIHARFWVKGDGVEPLGRGRLSPWQRLMRGACLLRQRTLEQLERAIPAPWSALMAAVLLGERSQLPQDLNQALVHSGLMHLTAISGLHVTFIVCFLVWALRALGLTRKGAAAVALPCVVFFLAMIGFRLPTVRAVMMGFAVMLSFVVERDADALSSISGAGLLILFLWPLSAFQAGFQLSFVIVMALICLTPRWDALYPDVGPRWGRWLWDSLGASLVAQLAATPLLTHYFSIAAPIAVLGNLIAIPLVGVLLGLGLVFILGSVVWSAIPLALGPPAFFLLASLEGVVRLFASVPGGHFFCPRFHPLLVVGWYGALALLAAGPIRVRVFGKIRPLRKPVLMFSLAVVLAWGWVLWPERRTLEIDFLALGQGDCIYIEFPSGGNLLVDGGPRLEPAVRPTPLEAYFHRRGVRRINVVVNTHPQEDHIGNLPELLDTLAVDAVFDNGLSLPAETSRALQEAVRQEGCRYQPIRRGQQIHGFPGVTIDVLSPNPRYASLPVLDTNVQSIVLLIRYGDFSCLLTGDIPASIEAELVQADLAPPVWVLKVPHHGSRFSTSDVFLEAVRPELAVIQVGRNPYGHPAAETLDRLRDEGVMTLRTDSDGTIRLTSDGTSYSVWTMARPQAYAGGGL